jgi:CBS domain containing-hemolysin-like protein
MIVPPLIIVLLLALNALYVAGEFAAVSVRRTRVRQAAENGSATARWVLRIVEDGAALDRYVAGCQIGITLSSIVLGAYTQAAITPGLGDLLEDRAGMGATSAFSTASVGLLIVVTSTQVVLGELLPKSIALQFPTQTVIYTSIPMRGSLWFFRPLIAILNGSGIAILRLLRTSSAGHRHIHSPGEISLLIAESRDGGLLSEDEQERFTRALRLSILPVRRLMVPRLDVVGIEADATLAEIRETLMASRFTRLPVYEGSMERVIGVLHAKEVARRVADGATAIRARDVMRPIASVPESMRAERLVAELRRQHSEQAIVVDEHGGTVGLVTLEDLLAEVLGATDVGDHEPERLDDGRVRLPGRMRVDDARDWLGITWEGESNTLGGIVSEHLGRIPAPGDTANIEGIDVEIEAVESHAVTSLLVRPVGGGVPARKERSNA